VSPGGIAGEGKGAPWSAGPPCPGHGHARHGADHGALQLWLALVRFVPEVLSSSSMGRHFSCSSKNKSRRVSWAVTARFLLFFFHLSEFLAQVDLGAPQAGPWGHRSAPLWA
jgi:hypothetical protein